MKETKDMEEQYSDSYFQRMNSNYFGTDEGAKVWFNKEGEGIAMSLLVQGILLFTYLSQMVLFSAINHE